MMGSPSISPPRSMASPMRGGTSQPMRSSGPTARLEHVSERFAGLWTDLEQEKQNRRMADSTRATLTHDTLQKLEKSLESEVKRRAESDKQLQSHFEGEIKSLQDRSAAHISELQSALKTAVESVSSRIQDLHSLIREEREQRRNDIEHLATSLVGKVNECVQALDEERSNRVQEQTISLKRFGEDLMSLQVKVDQERVFRDTELNALRGEIHDALGSRNMTDEQFKGAVLDEVATLKAAVALEREERVAEDDEIVQAVNDYTRALQEGLKLVST